MSMPDRMVDVAGLAKAYDGRMVVSQVSMTLDAGQIVGLVGANGGGKTTTLRMIAGLIRPDQGDGRVLGSPIGASNDNRRRRIGYMGQKLALYPDLTVLETLRFHATVHGLPQPRVAIAHAIDHYGIGNIVGQRCGTLSGGWARRVQFAATVLAAPALLLLDEPTAGLDVATRRDIWSWIGDFAAAGHGVIISTHDLIEAEQCPSILLYDGGVAHTQTSPAALIQAEAAPTLEAAVLALADRARR